MIAATSGFSTIVLDVPQSVQDAGESVRILSATKECADEIDRLFDQVVFRNNTTKEMSAQGRKPDPFEPIVVVINSITALKSVLSDQGNEKLSLILEKGSVAYQINILIGEQAKSVSMIAYEKWYKANVSTSDGIWVGSGIAEQYFLKPGKTTPEMHEDVAEGFGYTVQGGKACKVKLVAASEEEENDG